MTVEGWYSRRYRIELHFDRMRIPARHGERWHKQGSESTFSDQIMVKAEFEPRRFRPMQWRVITFATPWTGFTFYTPVGDFTFERDVYHPTEDVAQRREGY